jgi:hypothetical protein
MRNNRVEYYFLKRSVEQFRQDLCKLENLIIKKILSDDEFLEIMMGLVVVKENIERLEKICLKMIG